MKKALCLLLASLMAMGSVASLSACDLSDIDYINSLLQSGSEETDQESGKDDSSSESKDDSASDSTDDSSSEEEKPEEQPEEKPEEQPEVKPEVTPETPPSDGEEEEEGEKEETSDWNGVLDFTVPAITKQYGYNALARDTNGAGMQRLYERIYQTGLAFSENTGDVGTDQNGRYCISEINITGYGLTSNQAIGVWASVRRDYPEFWWLSNQIAHTSTTLQILIDEDYALGQTRATINTALQNLASDCARYISATDSETERALDIYEYLSANFSYAYDASGYPSAEAWAHNIVGGALYKKGVCETYAETYEWFCELFGLECTVVSGYGVTESGSDNHAWNAVRVDGQWFGVDATWSNIKDQNGNTYIMREWFGMGKTAFEKSHIVNYTNNYGVNYQVNAPTLSESYLCPVYYGIKGQTKVFAPSIDHAFAQMTDTTAHYQIELYPKTDITNASARKLYPGGAAFISKTTPKVAKLDIIGRYIYVTATSYWESELTFPNTLTLQCNLTLKEVRAKNDGNVVAGGYQYSKQYSK